RSLPDAGARRALLLGWARPTQPLGPRQTDRPESRVVPPSCNARLALHPRRDGRGDEALVVRALVEPTKLLRRRSRPGESDDGAERHDRHGELALRVLLEDTLRLVAVLLDDPTRAGRQRQEPKHVAARKRRHKCLLGIHCAGIGQGYAHDLRRARRTHDDASVEVPFVSATVAIIGEYGAFSTPHDRRGR